MKRFLDRIQPGRKIDANSAVLLPFKPDGKPDYAPFEAHLLRTVKAGITPAVNMDTGFGPQLTPAQRVEVLPGDLLLVRTGHMSRYLDRNDWRHYDLDPFPGVSVHTAPWLHARQIAAIASDNYAVEVRPSEIAGFRNPFHVVAIPNMGLTLGEIFFLEELAADCAADGRYAFLLVAPPLPVTRAVGTPINPYALK